MTIHELKNSQDQDLATFTCKVMEVKKQWASAPGAARESHFECFIGADATGQIEVKVWNQSRVAIGQTYSFVASVNGTGISLATDDYKGKITKQVVIQPSAAMEIVSGAALPAPAPAPQPAQPQAQPAPQQPQPAQQQKSKEEKRKLILLGIAELLIASHEAVHKYVAPEVLKRTGHTMTDGERQAAVSSCFITGKDRGALDV